MCVVLYLASTIIIRFSECHDHGSFLYLDFENESTSMNLYILELLGRTCRGGVNLERAESVSQFTTIFPELTTRNRKVVHL